MGITVYSKFEMYKDKIFSLEYPLIETELVSDTFLLDKADEKNLAVYYAPVEYINDRATILVVGITPGLHQMKKAYAAILNCRNHLTANETMLHYAKMASSYEGQMRKNLVGMLDNLQLPKFLGIRTSFDLFEDASQYVHTTGLLPYPVFYKNRNFTGANPNILKTDFLKNYVMNYFVNDISRLQNPLIIPLGVNVEKVLQYLASRQLLSASHILTGFPHPSGANGHRHKQFAENKERMKKQIEIYFKNELHA
jgi:hypothetical protein